MVFMFVANGVGGDVFGLAECSSVAREPVEQRPHDRQPESYPRPAEVNVGLKARAVSKDRKRGRPGTVLESSLSYPRFRPSRALELSPAVFPGRQ